MQLTCPKISKELLLPQLLSSRKRGASPSLGKSNHVEFYLVGGGQVDIVDLPIYLQKLLYRSLRNFSLNFRFVESSVFGRIHMSLAFCSCNGDWDHTFRSVFRVQPEAHHHLAHLEFQILFMSNDILSIYVRMYLCLCSTRPEHSLHPEISGLQSWDLAVREPGS